VLKNVAAVNDIEMTVGKRESGEKVSAKHATISAVKINIRPPLCDSSSTPKIKLVH
jgi:hypothetical protein